MAVRSGNHLQRRHEGYLRSDLLVATLRSIREVNVFVPRMTHQNFLHPEPTHPASCATSFTDPLARGGVLAEGVRLESVSTQQRKIHLRGYTIKRCVRLAYQPPASSTFISQQTSHQQPANSTFLSEETSTNHQPPAKRTG
jgi:hypothetical protein